MELYVLQQPSELHGNFWLILNVTGSGSDKRNMWSPSTRSHKLANGHIQIIKQYPVGLDLIDDLLPPEEYQKLLQIIQTLFSEEAPQPGAFAGARSQDTHSSRNGQTTDKKRKPRRVSVHYGPQFDYSTNHVRENPTPLPPWLSPVIKLLPHEINQATIQYYPPGAGIPPHIDTHSCFGKTIISYSLASTVMIDFARATEHTAMKMFSARRCVGGPPSTQPPSTPPPLLSSTVGTVRDTSSKSSTVDSICIPLHPNSLCVMNGEVRYAWTHGIHSRTTDPVLDDGDHAGVGTPERAIARSGRYSITFRYVEFDGTCNCPWKRWCDSQQTDRLQQGEIW